MIEDMFGDLPLLDTDFTSLRRELDRFFDSTRMMTRIHFPADLYEKDGNYVLEVSAPGFAKHELDVTASGNVLTVTGEHKTEKKKDNARYHYHEIARGQLYRTVTLPVDIDENAISAELKDGILTVTATPMKAIPTKKVEIKG
ncbi:MAG: Hsp20/alpha crystallin family protein [Vulcanimicrobiaceae bacterium]